MRNTRAFAHPAGRLVRRPRGAPSRATGAALRENSTHGASNCARGGRAPNLNRDTRRYAFGILHSSAPEVVSHFSFSGLQHKDFLFSAAIRFRIGSNSELWFVNRTEAMPEEQLHEFRQTALFVGAKVIVNVPAEVVLAKIVVIFGTAADDGIECVQAEAPRFAQLSAQPAILNSTTQRPDGINERQLCQFKPAAPRSQISCRRDERRKSIADLQSTAHIPASWQNRNLPRA